MYRKVKAEKMFSVFALALCSNRLSISACDDGCQWSEPWFLHHIIKITEEKEEEKILLSKNKTWSYVINLYGSIKSFYLGISREKTHIFDNVRFCTIFQRRPDKDARCFLICFYMASLLCSSCRLLTFFFINSYYY